ncbi:MAG: hypothetical protein U0174_16210 [Polyangiaceae bacterium]
MKKFFRDETKKLFKETIQQVEAGSSAELVIAVRDRSANYRDVDWLGGAIVAFLVLIVVIFHPAELNENFFPIHVLVGFTVGAFAFAQTWPVKRLLVSGERKKKAVREAARDYFVEARIDRTQDRTGILAFISGFEQKVEWVIDAGVDTEGLRNTLAQLTPRLDAAVASGDPERFAREVQSLAPLLSASHPRKEGDINELPDEVSTQ